MFSKPVAYKGNDGRVRRRKITDKVLGTICICSIVCYFMKSAPSTKIDVASSVRSQPSLSRADVIAQRYRRKDVISTSSQNERTHRQGVGDRKPPLFMHTTDKEKLDLILSGAVHLVSLTISRNKDKPRYEGVKATFCSMDFAGYKADPSANPMYHILVQSPSCRKSMITYDMKEIVKLATAYDGSDIHVMEPSGFIFHESRCGSTLVANALTAMDTEQHRVYSKARAPLEAMVICGLDDENVL